MTENLGVIDCNLNHIAKKFDNISQDCKDFFSKMIVKLNFLQSDKAREK